MLKKFPDAKYNQGYTGTSRTDSISRSFPFFEATGLIELKNEKRPIINAANELVTDLEDESDGDKSKIYLVPEQIESVRYLLEKFDPFLIYDQDNKVDWENYHGGNNIE